MAVAIQPAAAVQAEVYRSMVRNGDVPLGRWATPTRHAYGSADLNSRLMNAIRTSYGSAGSRNVYETYTRAFDAVMPAVQEAATRAASDVVLAGQQRRMSTG